MAARTNSAAGRRGQDHGAAFVELVVALPVLLVILIGTADFARVFYAGIELTNAARAGAQWGVSTLARSGDTAGMQAAAIAAAPNISGVTVTATQTCKCATNAGVYSSLVSGTCATPPATSCLSPSGLHRVVYVTVTTNMTFTTLARVLPSSLNSMPLSRTAVLRVAD